jgi:hypothetical protein
MRDWLKQKKLATLPPGEIAEIAFGLCALPYDNPSDSSLTGLSAQESWISQLKIATQGIVAKHLMASIGNAKRCAKDRKPLGWC